ncbi:hypothetical protein V499_09507 [Pseudogymnoascus sp. VKM F-103]|nr:hypothetical protein V499_09507 [Pseudogymnoascus sp. VKM F-103]
MAQEQKYYGRRGRPRAFSAAPLFPDPRSPESTATITNDKPRLDAEMTKPSLLIGGLPQHVAGGLTDDWRR